jgi:hypothetical protein
MRLYIFDLLGHTSATKVQHKKKHLKEVRNVEYLCPYECQKLMSDLCGALHYKFEMLISATRIQQHKMVKSKLVYLWLK